jgi:hypothetical protein
VHCGRHGLAHLGVHGLALQSACGKGAPQVLQRSAWRTLQCLHTGRCQGLEVAVVGVAGLQVDEQQRPVQGIHGLARHGRNEQRRGLHRVALAAGLQRLAVGAAQQRGGVALGGVAHAGAGKHNGVSQQAHARLGLSWGRRCPDRTCGGWLSPGHR